MNKYKLIREFLNIIIGTVVLVMFVVACIRNWDIRWIVFFGFIETWVMLDKPLSDV